MTIDTCPFCKSDALKKSRLPYTLYGKSVGTFKGTRCTDCGQNYFDNSENEKIIKKVKQLGLWGLEAEVKITQRSSNLCIQIPKRLERYYRLKKGDTVLIAPTDKHSIRILL